MGEARLLAARISLRRALRRAAQATGREGSSRASTAPIQTPTSTQLVARMTGLDRKTAKAVNFAKIYGAGLEKFAE